MLSVYKDTNTINSKQDDPFVNKLEDFAKKFPNFLIMEKTDTLDTELMKNPTYNSKRLKKSSEYIESYGAFVLGHSRLNYSVFGSSKDDKILSEIIEMLFGKKVRSEYTENEIRDAMHIATAIKYGGIFFITYDGKLLASSEKIRKRFNSVIICKPKDCCEQVEKKLRAFESNLKD